MASLERKRNADALSTVTTGEFAFEYIKGTWKKTSVQLRCARKRRRVLSAEIIKKLSLTEGQKYSSSRRSSELGDASNSIISNTQSRQSRKLNPPLHHNVEPTHVSIRPVEDLEDHVDSVTSRFNSWSITDLKAWRKERSKLGCKDTETPTRYRVRGRQKEARREVMRLLRAKLGSVAEKTVDVTGVQS